MSSTSAVVLDPQETTERRTLLLGNRLFLGANTMVMLAMLFAFLFLRSQNYGGMWRPDGIAGLAGVPMAIMLLLQLGCLAAVLAALSAAQRGTGWRSIGAVALVLSLVAGGLRVWYQYNLGDGWVISTSTASTPPTGGTYAAVSEMWLGLLIVEVLLGSLWLLSIVLPGQRARDRAASLRHLRAFSEFWLYLLIVSTFVFLLIRLV
jgi:heme/copper-type cytochrome/quinol oxidase subunit 3